jgi:hypothetical protein
MLTKSANLVWNTNGHFGANQLPISSELDNISNCSPYENHLKIGPDEIMRSHEFSQNPMLEWIDL